MAGYAVLLIRKSCRITGELFIIAQCPETETHGLDILQERNSTPAPPGMIPANEVAETKFKQHTPSRHGWNYTGRMDSAS